MQVAILVKVVFLCVNNGRI